MLDSKFSAKFASASQPREARKTKLPDAFPVDPYKLAKFHKIPDFRVTKSSNAFFHRDFRSS